MKVAFDENIPKTLVSVFSCAFQDQVGDYEISSAKDYADAPAKTDVPWLKKFADAGGKVVITADKKMRGKPHERKALKDLGLITFFFNPLWNHLKYFDKLGIFIRWWPHIVEKIETSKPGQCWEIPLSPTGGADSMKDVTYDK